MNQIKIIGCQISNSHSKKCCVVLTQFWVKYGKTQPLGYILIQCLSPYLTQKIGLKQPSIFRVHWTKFCHLL